MLGDSNYKNDVMTSRHCVHKSVMEETKRIIDVSEITKEDDVCGLLLTKQASQSLKSSLEMNTILLQHQKLVLF
jgi:hypothetical protein